MFFALSWRLVGIACVSEETAPSPLCKENHISCKELAASLRNYMGKLKTATRFRNRIVHDGMIKVDIDISIMGLSVNLAQDPDNETSPMNKDAVSFCEETKADILKLLDGSYELILQHIETQGKPPW